MPKFNIQGTPEQVGAKVWEMNVLPFLQAVDGRPAEEKAQFYVGLISSAMGALAADVGHHSACEIMQEIHDSIASSKESFPDHKVH